MRDRSGHRAVERFLLRVELNPPEEMSNINVWDFNQGFKQEWNQHKIISAK